jgi:hypothetical protein
MRQKLIKEQKEYREKGINDIKNSLKSNYEQTLNSIGDGRTNIPLNKIRLGLAVLCSLLCFIMIILSWV